MAHLSSRRGPRGWPMEPTHKRPGQERENTDTSLRTEREKTDSALEKKQVSIEGKADAVVEQARSNADQVMKEARTQADQEVSQSRTKPQTRDAVAQERIQADSILSWERTTADKQIRDERSEHKRAVVGLLSLEREETNNDLLTERARSDEGISLREDFLAMVSHDLRTLLSTISMTAALIKKTAPQDDAGLKTIRGAETIQRSSAQMTRLVEDLVDIASIEAGKLRMDVAQTDAMGLLREAVEAFHSIASAKKIALTAELSDQPLMVELDRARIFQVLANLISNAIKFTSEGGRIVLQVELVATEVRFSVVDNGAGIPVDKLEAIFERFWQVGKNDRRGLGLGLYISRCIVEAHGGRIWPESQLGAGSTFYFTVPRARRPG